MAAARKTSSPARHSAGVRRAPDVRYAIEERLGPAKRAVITGLRAYNDRTLGAKRRRKPLAITLRDAGEIVGGLIAESEGPWLFMRLLWIDDAHRGRGAGTTLMRMAEDEARRRGASGLLLETASFQAPGFYKKLGFRECGRLADYPRPGLVHHWLAKDL